MINSHVEAMITLSPGLENNGNFSLYIQQEGGAEKEKKCIEKKKRYHKMHSRGASKPGGKKLPAGQKRKRKII